MEATEAGQAKSREEAIIALREVYKSYHTPAGPFLALRNIHLSILPGEFVAIMGKSGAGKSTLVNVLTGIDQADSGELIINGSPIHTFNEDQRSRWRGRNLGVVFQFFQLLPSLNLIENITMAMDLTNTFPAHEQKQRALQLLEQVGIVEHALKPPSKISGGQQQRVAIARALAADPPILVADEPTGNLDTKTRDGILDIFSRLAESGKTILVVTHDKEIAARAGRTLYLKDGKFIGGTAT
ncbi:MAG: ABC transporter ATP-binding protein [Anaerolineaceae bacterium]|nr:ABC transporter ATP-binding protein [Anaerolineaceae bacterium]